ncbi:MAG TPA: helix-turn-helix domain-containing protein [Thermoleophilaceae bacterium]|nr:helix-turn-helix domain-containing protein [Thermoleophilaceae bacterium]
MIEIQGPQAYARLVVEARERFEPRDVERLGMGLLRKLRQINDVPVLVVASWLSPRTRELLAAEGLNYLDLTGNAQIRLNAPALFLSSEGSARNPAPVPPGSVKLRGRKAARLIRLLTDVRPPYGVGQVAAATGLTQGYVSRLLDSLDREALIDRSPRGGVETVEVVALVRRWAESYDVLGTNGARWFIAPNGAESAMRGIASLASEQRVAVTGSFAAVRMAPVAAPALMMAYCDAIDATADTLGLLPADEGANVILLEPFDSVAWRYATEEGGVVFAAPSQVAVDCLTGTGRMPAEGEALLRWMESNERSWRARSLDFWGDSA